MFCSELRVPLDHSGRVSGHLTLQVAVADRPVEGDILLALSGGPGQPGVVLVPRILPAFEAVRDKYRLVMLDQRGTGEAAIRCRSLQQAVGGSDILVPPPTAVRRCAATIGSERRFYTTADTVADLDLLRRALGVEKWTLDGVSYGTFTAERYAMTFPDHVRALILDSVVPHDGFDPFLRANLRRTAYALRDACEGDGGCSSDPAEDLAWIIRNGGDGVGILNALTLDSIIDPAFREIVDVPEALHEARRGDPSGLERFVALYRRWSISPADELSAGLHAASLCGDQRFPWGDASTPVGERRITLRRAVAEMRPVSVWPFDRATAAGNGFIQGCLHWPAVPTPSEPRGELSDVPVLIVHGERDLSTPLAWAREEAAAAENAVLVVVPDAGHSVQVLAADDSGRRAVAAFLLGRAADAK